MPGVSIAGDRTTSRPFWPFPVGAPSRCAVSAVSPDARSLDVLSGQLDRYQAVISRLANNQVQVKTWCVTALAALAALAVNNKEQGPLAIGLVVLCTFFFLDAYYLALERHFREESRR